MANILDSSRAANFNDPVTAFFKGVKKGLLFACGFALVVMMQVTFFSSGAIASPLANMGSPVDKVAETSKNLAKDVKEGTKENIGKAKKAAKDTKSKVDGGVDKAKQMASDRTNELKNGASGLPDKAGNKVEEAIDSVKDFLKQ
ncbi:hypothetical protein H6F42_17165 [Pseudanabaena sp. FACHB-1998]|uniref:hypothetical protein n=1 Tax=Pseudanabaena sp. FACHB-1998 TaxID=2692858 RepID=UPI001680B3E2|nr:hypothetical protein [Pseudanabaena sp. FACHB-1998]MBD2178651.1 hypothetical protein [Pseudanabaena sp. FACHB-1998]